MPKTEQKSDIEIEDREREISWEEFKKVIRNMMRAGVEENIRKNKAKEKQKSDGE